MVMLITVNLDEFKKLYDMKLNDAEIGRRLNLPTHKIRYQRNKLRLPPNKKRYLLDEDTEKIMYKLYQEKKNDSEIGLIVGRAKQTVRNWRIKNNLKSNVKKSINLELYKEKINLLHKSGDSIKKMSIKLNVPYDSLRTYLKKHGYDTSRSRTSKKKLEDIIKHLEVFGPEENKYFFDEYGQIILYGKNKYIDKIQKIRLTGSSTNRKYRSAKIWGENAGKIIWTLKNDSKLIDYLKNKIVLQIKSPSDKRALSYILSSILGSRIAKKIVTSYLKDMNNI